MATITVGITAGSPATATKADEAAIHPREPSGKRTRYQSPLGLIPVISPRESVESSPVSGNSAPGPPRIPRLSRARAIGVEGVGGTEVSAGVSVGASVMDCGVVDVSGSSVSVAACDSVGVTVSLLRATCCVVGDGVSVGLPPNMPLPARIIPSPTNTTSAAMPAMSVGFKPRCC